MVLSTFDEGPDLVLYYKYLMFLRGDADYELHFIETDALDDGQAAYARFHLEQFDAWWAAWEGKA